MKECLKCKEIKTYDAYYKSIRHKDGYFNICKVCKQIEYDTKKKEKIKYQNNYNNKNKNRIKEYNKTYQKEYYSLNKEKIQKRIQEKKEKIQKYNKEYYYNNKVKYSDYSKQKYKQDPQFKLKQILRCRFYDLLNKKKKEKSIINLIDCSIKELKQYLEQQFKPEMTWENHGIVWEIDHIKPCNSFNLINIEEQKQCFHYTNLQPLFKTTEIAKQYGYENEIGNRNKLKK